MAWKRPHKITLVQLSYSSYISWPIHFRYNLITIILTLSGMTSALMPLQFMSSAAGHRFKTVVKKRQRTLDMEPKSHFNVFNSTYDTN